MFSIFSGFDYTKNSMHAWQVHPDLCIPSFYAGSCARLFNSHHYREAHDQADGNDSDLPHLQGRSDVPAFAMMAGAAPPAAGTAVTAQDGILHLPAAAPIVCSVVLSAAAVGILIPSIVSNYKTASSNLKGELLLPRPVYQLRPLALLKQHLGPLPTPAHFNSADALTL